MIRSRTLEKSAGALSIAAGFIHSVVAPAHLEEWWGYGLFFIVAAAFQILFGLALVTHAINPTEFGPGAERARRILFILGVVVNIGIIALYVVSRTSGIPWFGPEAGDVEEIGLLDLAAGVFEIGVIVFVALLLPRTPRSDVGSRAT